MPALPLAVTPIGPIILVVCIGSLIYTLIRTSRQRATAERVIHGPLYGGSRTARKAGTAVEIADGGQVPAQELLGALGVGGATAEPAAPELDDEGVEDPELEQPDTATDDEGTAKLLGLHYHRFRHKDYLWDPTVLEGTRNGHQVFIRLGRNATASGPGVGFRHSRNVTVVRVASPEFEIIGADGVLRPKGEFPEAVKTVLGQMHPSPDVWQEMRILAGPDGLVSSRAMVGDWVGGWIYDLWLLERLAETAGGEPLKHDRLVRAWEPPYEMGDWAPSALSSFGL